MGMDILYCFLRRRGGRGLDIDVRADYRVIASILFAFWVVLHRCCLKTRIIVLARSRVRGRMEKVELLQLQPQ